jgi:glycine oxidase
MHSADVVVVGAGLVGLATALRLSEAGFQVTVVDQGRAGSEASGAGAGLLTPQALTGPPPRGAEDLPLRTAAFQASYQSRALYPVFVEKIVELTRQPVSYAVDGVLALASDPGAVRTLEDQVAWQTEQGLEARMLDASETAARAPGLQAEAAAFFPHDGYVDNQTLVTALLEAVRGSGVPVIEDVPVVRIETEKGAVSGVRTARETLACGGAVLAAGAWTDPLLPIEEPKLEMRPVRGQIVVLEGGPAVPRHPVLCGETYLVPRPHGRVLAGSTVEEVGFDRSVTAGGVAEILEAAAAFLPALRGWTFAGAWSGLRPRAGDGYPVIGPAVATGGLWIATGHYRNGILWAPLTAEWITRGILGETYSAEARLLGPARFQMETRS